MAEVYWYGTDADHQQFLTWLLAEPGLALWQEYSDFDQKLKRFRDARDVIADTSRPYPNGRPHFPLYVLYLRGSGPRFRSTRYALDPRACDGATFRYIVTKGLGLMDMTIGPMHQNTVLRSGFRSPVPSRTWKPWGARGAMWDPARWDYNAISAQARKITGFIRKNAVTQLGDAFVLPGAHQHWLNGGKLGSHDPALRPRM